MDSTEEARGAQPALSMRADVSVASTPAFPLDWEQGGSVGCSASSPEQCLTQ